MKHKRFCSHGRNPCGSDEVLAGIETVQLWVPSWLLLQGEGEHIDIYEKIRVALFLVGLWPIIRHY
jgi:hypothetical protein